MRFAFFLAFCVLGDASLAALAGDVASNGAAKELPVKPSDVLEITSGREVSGPGPNEVTILSTLVPREPVRLDVFYVLRIVCDGMRSKKTIDHFYLVESDGQVDLGPTYGRVLVKGLTPDEATAAIARQVEKVAGSPKVWVGGGAHAPFVDGRYRLDEGGVIHLGRLGALDCGKLDVTNKTPSEIKRAVEEHLTPLFVAPEVTVRVLDEREKSYCLLSDVPAIMNDIRNHNEQALVDTDAANQKDSVSGTDMALGDFEMREFAWSGKETVLDAINAVGGLSQVSGIDVWISRTTGNHGCEGILPVDVEGIAKDNSAALNDRLMPGDRVYIMRRGRNGTCGFYHPWTQFLMQTDFAMSPRFAAQLREMGEQWRKVPVNSETLGEAIATRWYGWSRAVQWTAMAVAEGACQTVQWCEAGCP